MTLARIGSFVWLLVGLCTACFRVGYDELSDCAPGQDCTSDPSDVAGADGGVHEQPGRDGGAAPETERDGGTPLPEADASVPGEPGALGCGSLLLLQEGFEGQDIGVDWYSLGNGAVTLSEGQLELVLTGAAAVEVTYNSHASYDLRSAELAVELVQSSADVAGLALRDGKGFDRFSQPLEPDERGVALSVDRGELRALALAGSEETTLASLPYDAVQHRHLRLREAEGLLFWETSPDRVRWSAFHMERPAMDTSGVFAMLYARSAAGEGSVAFDRINEPVEGVPGYCATSELRDDFEDGSIGPAFRPWNGAGLCTVDERDGAAHFTFDGAFAACALKANPKLSLRDAALAFELAELPNQADVTSLIELTSPQSGEAIELRIVEGEASMRMLRANEPLFEATVSFDPVAARFWRFREASGRTYWDSSADGVTWETRGETDTNIDVDELLFALWGLDAGSGAPQVMRFGGVNTP